MASKHRTINITVSDNRVERNPRSARPMDDRTYLGRLRSRTEKNPRSVPTTGERSSSIIAKLRSRTCIDESWIAASRRSIQPRVGGMAPPSAAPAGSSEVDRLLAQRYGQVRLVPSRISSLRGPYDLRYSTSCQSATVHRRRANSGVDPRFRRTIRVVDGSEGKEETDPEPMALNFGERLLPLEGLEKRCPARAEPGSSQGSSRINVGVQATSKDADEASEQSSSVNVAVQTQQWPRKVRASSARRETTDSGRAVKLKRSSSDTCIRAHKHHKDLKGFRHGGEGRGKDVSLTPREEGGTPPRCDQCRPERSRGPTAGPERGGGAHKPSERMGKIRSTAALARRVARDGYAYRAISGTVRTFVMVLILLSLAWFLFIGMDVLRDWWSPPNTGWGDTCKWFILNMLRRITILEKCKCS